MAEAMKEDILASLEPLFARARAEGLWFYSNYQQLWFSPDDLAAQHRIGGFVWGPGNWQLRDPQERLAELRQQASGASKSADDFERKLKQR